MREYSIANVPHMVYDDSLEVPGDIKVVKDWRAADIGDWVLADDGGIIQIIRCGVMKQRKRFLRYVGTCTGTFVCLPNINIPLRK